MSAYRWEVWEIGPGGREVRVDAWLTFDAASSAAQQLAAQAGGGWEYEVHDREAGDRLPAPLQ